MNWYTIAKFVHFLGVIALFGSFVISARAGTRLRAATTTTEIRTWLDMIEATRPMVEGGAGMLLVSGLTMSLLRWRGAFPFIAVGLVVLIVIGMMSATIVRSHLASIRRYVSDGNVPSDDLMLAIHNPAIWSLRFALNAGALGVVFVMTTKPGWIVASAIVVVAATIGALVGQRLAGQRSKA
jgi:hypothetical protein